MRKLFVILTTSLLSSVCLAQTGFYVGYENGGLFERYTYINSKAKTLSQSSIGGIIGGYIGYKYNLYTVETGFYGLFHSRPMVGYNYITSEVRKSSSMSSGDKSWLIPLRFGIEFLAVKNKFFFKPEIGFNVSISSDYSKNQPSMGWGENVSVPWDTSYIPNGPDSTRAYGYITSKVALSIEPSISLGYRIRNKAAIYIKGSYIASFIPTYYETITHYSEFATVYATRYTESSIVFQIGFKYYFAKCKK